jgi:predicted permease
VRFAIRRLFKDRSFSVTAFLTIAVCIAANTAIFSVVRSVLLRPLPVPESDRLVVVYNSYPNAGAARAGTAVPDYFDRRREVPALAEQALFRRETATFGAEGGAERLITLRATPSFFRLVRLEPRAGRLFHEEEGEAGKNSQTILGYGFWQRAFGGETSIVGQTIRLNGTPMTVVGVAPATFTFLWDDIDLFMPAAFTPQELSDDSRHSNNWQMIGRLAPGATIDQVQQQVDAINARNDERFPHFRQVLKDAGYHSIAVPLQQDVVRDVRAVLYLLWGGVLFVLLLGCLNLMNLVMVRSSARLRELATRQALGANPGRLARQLLTETLVLAVLGGAAGVALGSWALRGAAAIGLDLLPRGHEIGLDLVSVMVTLALTIAVGIVIGLAPVLRLWRMNLNLELREEGRGGTGGRRALFVRRSLATAQVAIAFVLLIGAGLLLASFRAVLGLDYGFSPARVSTASVALPQVSYPDNPAVIGFASRALEAVRALPAVEAAGLTSAVPFSGNTSNSVILAEGYEMKPGESLLSPMRIVVSEGYFEAIGQPMVRGRSFSAAEVFDGPRAVIVDERLARKFWPGQDPIGRRMYFPTDPQNVTAVTPQTRFLMVVGVVREVQFADPRADAAPVGAYYLPFAQFPSRGITMAVKSRTASGAAMNDVRAAMARLDPELPLFRVQPMQEWIDRALVGRRVPVYIAMAFGAVGLFLSAIGIYGVLAYGVSQRQRELGVRMALGSSASNVFGLVLRDGLAITAAGLVIGLAGAYFLGGVMQNLLFRVAPMEPGVLAAVAGTLGVVALVASVIPSFSAMRINPMVVLGK